MSDLKHDIMALQAHMDEMGSVRFWEAINKMRRWKVMNRLRDGREIFPLAEYRRLHKKQKGICQWCNKDMAFPYGKGHGLAIDHINANRQDFNDRGNLQLLHDVPCNREKSAKSVGQVAKETGKLYTEQIMGGLEVAPETPDNA